jgi:hypothetical protein
MNKFKSELDCFDEHHLGNILFDFYDPKLFIIKGYQNGKNFHTTSKILPDNLILDHYHDTSGVEYPSSYCLNIYKLNSSNEKELQKSVQLDQYKYNRSPLNLIKDNKIYTTWELCVGKNIIIVTIDLKTCDISEFEIPKENGDNKIIKFFLFDEGMIINGSNTIYVLHNNGTLNTLKINCRFVSIYKNILHLFSKENNTITKINPIDLSIISIDESHLPEEINPNYFIVGKNNKYYKSSNEIYIINNDQKHYKIKPQDYMSDKLGKADISSFCIDLNELKIGMSIQDFYDYEGGFIVSIDIQSGKVNERIESTEDVTDFIFTFK